MGALCYDDTVKPYKKGEYSEKSMARSLLGCRTYGTFAACWIVVFFDLPV